MDMFFKENFMIISYGIQKEGMTQKNRPLEFDNPSKHQDLWYADINGEIVEVVNDVDGITFTCVENGHGIWIEDIVVFDKCGDCKSKGTFLLLNENKIAS